ncbi:MAG: hypothetical protein JWN71_454 [Xanthobacteraceae bacterium]|jgi:hypothetical protein|nr:hypothetical protein [Xanthobacteraceae bacterium]
MKKLAVLAFVAGAALTTSSVAFAQYYEQPRHERQEYRERVECPHGFRVQHGRCVEIVVRQHCEDGWTWRDGHCRPPARRHYNSY